MVKNNKHHWIGPATNLKMLEQGKHPSQQPDVIEQARQRELNKIEKGEHIFLNRQWAKTRTKKIVDEGRHNFTGGEIQRRTAAKRVNDRTHNLLKENDPRIAARTHHMFGGEIQRNTMLKRLAAGTHPSQHKVICEHCGKTSSMGMYARWHGNRCKNKS